MKSSLTKYLPLAYDSLYLPLMLALLIQAGIFVSDQLKPEAKFAYVSGESYYLSDFAIYYKGGEIAASPDRQRVYDPQVQLEYFNRMFDNYKWNKPFFNQNVPFIFPLCIPLTWLPMSQSYAVWVACSFVFATAALSFLRKQFLPTKLIDFAVIVLALLASWPAVLSLRTGQPSLILSGLIGLYALFLYQKKDIPAGIVFAFMSFKLQYAPFYVIPALLSRRPLLLVSMAVTGCLLLLLAGLTIGFQNVINYPSILLHAENTGAVYGVHPETMVCLRGLLARWGLGSTGFAIAAPFFFASLLMNGWIWYKIDRQNPVQFAWAFALLVISALFFSLHTHLYDMLLLIVPALLTVPRFSFSQVITADARNRLWNSLLMLFPIASWLSVVSIFHSEGEGSRQIAMSFYEIILCTLAVKVLLGGRTSKTGVMPDADMKV